MRQIIAASVGITAAVTLLSVKELHQLTGKSRDILLDTSGERDRDWRAIAERAVKHVEHLPHLHGTHTAKLASRQTDGRRDLRSACLNWCSLTRLYASA